MNEAGEEQGTAKSRKRRREEDDEDESTMVISQQETDWALALKEAVLAGEETKDIRISDMELVQYAMVERGHISKAVERIRRISLFKATYQIEDTPEEGVACARKLMEHHPGWSLSVDQCPRMKHYVHVVDFAKWHPGRIRLERDWQVFMRGVYYLCTAFNPNLEAVRNGTLFIMEGEGMGWDNLCLEFEARFWQEHMGQYPLHIHEFSWVNTPMIGNIFFSLLKPILPERVREVIQLGVKFDESYDGRLDELFLQPTAEIANERQLKTIQSFLQTRYHNEKRFQLRSHT